MNTRKDTASVIRKWYSALSFPEGFDREFEKIVDTIPVAEDTCIETYDLQCADGKQNLLCFLYMCEALQAQYRRCGIGEDILMDTLRDIVRWTENWSAVKGELCLFELEWLARIMRFKLFKVGRLQFYMAPARQDVPEFGIRQGDPVVELHIPRGEKMSPGAVDASLAQGKAFLERYFPEYHYEYLTCISWLLDEKLKEYLPETSNIIHFGNRFHKVFSQESNFLLRFLFRWDTSEENLAQQVCNTQFQKTIRDAVLRGEVFHVTAGVLEKSKC